MVIDETARAGPAINVGVADASADTGDPKKENYIIWINDSNIPHGHDDGFFWNGNMAGDDTGGYQVGLPLKELGAVTVDIIVENRTFLLR